MAPTATTAVAPRRSVRQSARLSAAAASPSIAPTAKTEPARPSALRAKRPHTAVDYETASPPPPPPPVSTTRVKREPLDSAAASTAAAYTVAAMARSVKAEPGVDPASVATDAAVAASLVSTTTTAAAAAAAPATRPPPRKDWADVYTRISAWRRHHGAPVDEMGCGFSRPKTQDAKHHRYEVLTSLQLSSQTKDPVTWAAMQALRAEPGGCTPQAIVAMDPARLDNLIGKVGFHRRKTVYLQQTAQILLDQYDGDIPDSLEGLMALPGCGPKMSYLALSSAWGKTIGIGVDTHVHRISERLGWTMKPKTPEDTRHQLEAWLPLDRWVDINPMLVGFGQIQCLPIGPRCESCPVRDACPRVGVPRRSAKATARTVKMADTYSMADLAKDEAVKQET